ncbi:MAG: Sporulation domain protein [Bryobacterales bacterium]|nr:Sporulation domain protein [Bryobacterales bacterium]
MSKTDGEYELVLGNRQLLSAFFIIVILFGVFFTMGYVVGRNSAPASAASAPTTTVAANQRPEAASPASAPPPQSVAPVEEARPPAGVETKSTAPPERKEAPPRVAPPRVHESARPSEKAAPANAASAPAITPGPGRMYLQVAAAAQPQAGVVVDTLKQKGFPAILAQGPNATLFRVVVGPFPDTATLGKAKADLENAGFRPMVRK